MLVINCSLRSVLLQADQQLCSEFVSLDGIELLMDIGDTADKYNQIYILKGESHDQLFC